MVEQKQLLSLQGKVNRVIFRNSENYFTILALDSKMTVKGTFIEEPQKGEEYLFHGAYKHDMLHGDQFEVSFYERVMPSTLQGITSYLMQVNGVGKKTAQTIVKALGIDCLKILREQGSSALQAIPKLNVKKAEKIAAFVQQQFALEYLFTQLYSYGLTQNQILKIYKIYGEQSLSMIQQNPYEITQKVPGIGFLMADKIAQAAGLPKLSPNRIRAAIQHVVRETTYSGGHVFNLLNELIEKTDELLKLDEQGIPIIEEQLRFLLERKQYIYEDGRIYLRSFFEAEQQIAYHIKRIQKEYTSPFHPEDVHGLLQELELELNVTYAEKQREAIEKALVGDGILVLTGGPGTGKTTTVNGIVSMFKKVKQDIKISLAAPTGRAAKRMSESTEMEARTIHRMLEYGFQEGGELEYGEFRFGRDLDNPLDAELIIVDEGSMIDTLLMNDFLKAIPSGSKLIIVGDINQIPSVGPGTILKDLIESDVIEVVRLSVVYRQTGQSAIVTAANQILAGTDFDFSLYGRSNKEFQILLTENPIEVRNRIVQGIKILVDRGWDIMNIQVLAPIYRGDCGITALNQAIQESINPAEDNKSEWKYGTQVFRIKDKVLVTKNLADLDVYNGDVGLITAIEVVTEASEDDDEDAEPTTGKKMVVDINGRSVEFGPDEIESITLAYAISIHKSQGSEYPLVIIPLLTTMWVMLYRNLYYTAVTRAKKTCITMGQMKAVKMAIRRVEQTQRNTTLKERLKKVE